MSVPESLRHESEFQVFVATKALAAYTIQILGNKKNFPEEYEDYILKPIAEAAIDIHRYAWAANSIVVTQQQDYNIRHEYQWKAVATVITLESLIQIAKPVFHISAGRIQHWAELCVKARKLLQSWKNSDTKRFKAKLESE